MIQDWSQIQTFKRYATGSLLSLESCRGSSGNKVLPFDFKSSCLNPVSVDNSIKAGGQGCTGRQHVQLVPPEPTFTVLTSSRTPFPSRTSA